LFLQVRSAVAVNKKRSTTVLDGYARVSVLSDPRQRSTSGQIKDIRKRIERYGAQLGEILKDEGKSAWDPKVKRPDWDTLMNRLENGISDGVVVFDLARFSRRPKDGERLIEAAERGLIVLDADMEFDLLTPDGKSHFRDGLRVAAYQSDRMSTAVRRGMRERAENGDPSTRFRSFGFEVDAVTIREAEAVITREMAERLLDGTGLEFLAAELNERGIRTAGAPCLDHRPAKKERCSRCGRWKPDGHHGADGTWSTTKLRTMLLNEQNAGYLMFNGENMGRLPGDPILDEATWIDLCALFAGRRQGRPASYSCTGFVVCGQCTQNLTGHKPGGTYRDGVPRYQYRCEMPRAGRPGRCGRMTVDGRGLEFHARALVATVLSDPAHASAIEAAARSVKDARAEVTAKIQKIDDLLGTFADRLGNSRIELDYYDRIVEPQRIRRVELLAQLEKLGEPASVRARSAETVASEAEWLERWDAANVDERRALLAQALSGRVLVVNKGRRMPRFNPDRIALGPAPQGRKARQRPAS
jgi:site-specific DNA recombinase